MTDKEKILNLKEGEEATINWFEGGGGLVTRVVNGYILEEIPAYWGQSLSMKSFAEYEVDEMIALANTWT